MTRLRLPAFPRLSACALPRLSAFAAAFVLGLLPFGGAAPVGGPVAAGEYNPVLKIGDPAPDWKDLPGTDGVKRSLADYAGKQAVVVVFTCCSCDASTDYEARIARFVAAHCGPEGKVALVAINCNRVPADSLDAMKQRAETQKFAYPFLLDESQAVGRAYGATFTPEFFVLDGKRQIAYMGAFDDKSLENEVKVRYVEDAIAAVLKGEKPAVAETVARGCLVRYARPKRERPAPPR